MYCVPSAHWHTRAEETLALAETMSDGIAKQLTYRIAADYERLAQSAEHRPTEPTFADPRSRACRGKTIRSPQKSHLGIGQTS